MSVDMNFQHLFIRLNLQQGGARAGFYREDAFAGDADDVQFRCFRR